MALRTCPSCGTQYVATVRRCIDCGATLVDDASSTSAAAADAKSTSAGSGERAHVGYELPGWGNQLKTSLDGMLEREGVPRVWEAAALVVPADFEDAVDRLIAVVEGSDLPLLDDEAVQVALEIEGLDAETMDELDARLVAAAVAHAWDDDGALLVAEVDEAQVLALIDEVFADESDEDRDGDDSAGSADANRVLSGLFVAVDRLVKRATDQKLARAYLEAVDPLGDLDVPYGFEPAAWAEVVDEAEGLRTLLAPDDDDDEGGDEGEGVDPEVGEVDDVDEADDAVDVDDEAAAEAADEVDGGVDPDDDDDADEDDGSRIERRARALREQLREIV